ncbi:gamma-glutamylcyclotransferase family protein [Pseudalkalibacillus hwajinpoensis]|uniref:gamma-glutamylcyclotransferase family protein n=1 Tax=Guptibacillus hwajinpoensis TaxID=208199 RepID=UPI001CD2B105|nr:gamma-glutamylcyclotransferase [Pseudalkalibacillus hwajinpoensis]MCA0992310.1 gamma-glutamylcyclotransferase [Pseudalkalibacillus hwajinpoensis]
MYLVFCYGTLRSGESNHAVIKEATLIESFSWTNGQLYDTRDGYPALIQNEDGTVYGEVYEVDDQLLEKINLLEGYQEGRDYNLYEQVMQIIESNQGSYEAITYMMRKPERRFMEIPGGDWVTYRNRKG